MKKFILVIFVLLASPSVAEADLILPTTNCDDQQENFVIFGVNQHLTASSVREDGTRAFEYGAGADPFVSESDGVITLRFHTLFEASSTVPNYIKLFSFDANCNSVFGYAPLFQNSASPADHTLAYADNGFTVTLNGDTQNPLVSGSRYFWIEVWDGINGSTAASYSYLIDTQNIENPEDDTPAPPPAPPPPPPSPPEPVVGGGFIAAEVLPEITVFEADRYQIKEGEIANIKWETERAHYVTFDIYALGDAPKSGDLPVSPEKTTTYKLTAQGLGGEVYKELTIEVLPRDPVIIVPGILGSFNNKLDPILRTYEGMINGLKSVGYVEDKSLFRFPYNWRKDNRDTARLLDEKIKEVLEFCVCDKVDIVAHSMGGLVSKYYIQNINRTTIDQLIFLGSPHRGAPKAYLAWEAGQMGDATSDNVIETIFKHEAKALEFSNVVQYIQNGVPAIKQLLPIYDYLYDTTGSRLYPYQSCEGGSFACNEFLEDLDEVSAEELNIKLYNVISDEQSTMRAFILDQSVDNGDFWKNGKPLNYPDAEGILIGTGDGTVPIFSAELLASQQKKVNAEHRYLPYMTQSQISNILVNKEIPTLIGPSPYRKILFIRLGSPADISVTDANGDPLPDIFYSGTEDPEFITVPDPVHGEYQITVVGTGEGHFELETTFIADDLDLTKTFQGEIKTGEVFKFSIQTTESSIGDLVVLESPLPETPTSTPTTTPVIIPETKVSTPTTTTPTLEEELHMQELRGVKGVTLNNEDPSSKMTFLLVPASLGIVSVLGYLIFKKHK